MINIEEKKMNPSLTVIMPAYNQAHNLRLAFESTVRALAKASISDYEILFVTSVEPNGSHDGTPGIADEIVSQNPKARHLFDGSFQNLGYRFRQGVMAAQKDYVTWVPSDNETAEDSVASILRHAGEADMVTSYTSNRQVRKWKRRFVSRCFTELCNLLFGLRFRYFNGICIYPTRLLQRVPMKSDNFAYMAEIIVYLAKSGVKYKQVPMEIKPTTATASFKLKSVFEVLGTLASLFWNIHIKRIRVNLT
jgi:glycosyltransferase involved in cell wall biosynthesis